MNEIEMLKRYIKSLEYQISSEPPKWQKLAIAQEESMSLMQDVEFEKNKNKNNCNKIINKIIELISSGDDSTENILYEEDIAELINFIKQIKDGEIK